MRLFTKKKQSEQGPVKKNPIYKELTTIPDNNNNNPFGSEKSLLQEQQQMNQSNLDEIRKEVEETKNIMGSNIIDIKNRGENLDNLDKTAEKIKKSSEQFKRNTKKVNKASRHENLRLKIFTYTICFLITLFFSYIAFSIKEQDSGVKILYLACSCLSTLCIGYLAVNDCKNAFDLCLEKISCFNKDNKQKEQQSDQIMTV